MLLTACTAQPGTTTTSESANATGAGANSSEVVSSETEAAFNDHEAGEQKTQRDQAPGRPEGVDSEEVNGLKAEDVLVPTPREGEVRIFGAITNASDKERKLVEIKASNGLTVKLAQDDHGGRGKPGGSGGPGGAGGPDGPGGHGDRPQQPQGEQPQHGEEPPQGQQRDDRPEQGNQGARPEGGSQSKSDQGATNSDGDRGQRPKPQVTTVENLTVPAKGTLELHPHEVFGLIESGADALKEGDTVTLEFVFDDGTSLKVEPKVAAMKQPNHQGGPGHEGGRGPGRGGEPPQGNPGGPDGGREGGPGRNHEGGQPGDRLQGYRQQGDRQQGDRQQGGQQQDAGQDRANSEQTPATSSSEQVS